MWMDQRDEMDQRGGVDKKRKDQRGGMDKRRGWIRCG
jgi:hypothetical protein